MATKKGGLGNNIKEVNNEELLDAAFFAKESPKGKKADIDTTPSINAEAKKKMIMRNFQITSEIHKKIKIYAIEHDMKEYEVINLAFTQFFENETE